MYFHLLKVPASFKGIVFKWDFLSVRNKVILLVLLLNTSLVCYISANVIVRPFPTLLHVTSIFVRLSSILVGVLCFAVLQERFSFSLYAELFLWNH